MDNKQLSTAVKKRRGVTFEGLPGNWKEILLDLAQDGDGKTAWCVYLGVSSCDFNLIVTENEEFSTEVDKAVQLQLLYWERQGKRMVNGGSGAQAVYAFIMTNKFGYSSQRNEVTSKAVIEASVSNTNTPLTKEELAKALEARGLPASLLIEQEINRSTV